MGKHSDDNKIPYNGQYKQQNQNMIPNNRHIAQKQSHNHEGIKVNKKSNNKKISKKSKIILRVLLVILILIVILFVSIYAFIRSKLNKINYIELNEEELGIDEQIDTQLKGKGYRNIVLLGVDTRDMKNIKGSRSDSIIIININQDTKEVKLISVFRDTYLDIEGHGLDKVTHAHAFGGPALTINTLNRNLDLNIKEFVTVNFKIVADLINRMGGIEIDIKKSEINEMNKYIKDTSKNTGLQSKEITSAGLQTLDGVQAVTYSRIRKHTGGDEKRNERMRTVLMKVFEKAKKMDIGTINKIADEILPNVQTNITANEIMSMIPQMASYKVNDNIGWPYETKGITLDRWYGVPITLESNVKDLYKNVFGIEDYEPSDTVKDISSRIVKKTGYK